MNYRKLRIAWSVAWGVVAVLFVVLWVRSYQHYESIARNNGKGGTTIFCSTRGTVHFVQDYMMNQGQYILPSHKDARRWSGRAAANPCPATIAEIAQATATHS